MIPQNQVACIFLSVILSGCTVAMKRTADAQYIAAGLGGKVQQVDSASGYAAAMDAEKSFRDGATALVLAVITKAAEAVQLADINEGEKTVRELSRQGTERAAIRAGVEESQIRADLIEAIAR